MDPRLILALGALTERLDATNVPFLLGGGALLHALGLVEDVGDLDLMARGEDRDRFCAATRDWLRSLSTEQTDLWASGWFAQLRVHGVPVDAIGAMAFRVEDRVARLPFSRGGTWRLGSVQVGLADPALWWAVYSVYSPKKAALLEAVVSTDRRRAVLVELGLDDTPLGRSQ